MGKFVYSFNEGSKDMRDLLGGKGANLAEMTKIGLPVPFGFTISTDACTRYYLNKGGMLDDEIVREVYEHLDELEQVIGKEVRRHRESASGFRSFRRTGFHAGNDGHDSEPGTE